MFVTAPHRPVVYLASQARTLGDLFRQRAERTPHNPAFFTKRGGHWQRTTWREFYDQASRAAGGLVELGLEPGEVISILGPTKPPWAVYDMGAQLAGLVSMGIYPNQSVEGLVYLLNHSDSRAIFVDSAKELKTVLEAAEQAEGLKAIVPWSEALYEEFKDADPRVMSPAAFTGAPLDDATRDARQRDPDDIAIFIYTSGTTGPPKGAMISHQNILSLLSRSQVLGQWYEDDISLSFLPMAHAAERVLAFYGRINGGISTAYATSFGKVLEELQEVRPTIFGSVPRLFEKAYGKIHSELEKKPKPVQRLFGWAVNVGKRRLEHTLDQKKAPLHVELQYKLADRLVFKKLRGAFGGRVRQMVTGAAPTAIEILELFWSAGLPIYEVYGQTEATVVTHANRDGSTKLGTVGRPIDGLEHKIAEDGEVLIRAPWVFKGYYKDEDATAKTVVDGWLHTGDIGSIDADGYLRITDRKKHIIITAGGKNLTPANIENAIKNQDPLISQVHAHGDKRPYVSAIVAPSPIETLEWGLEHNLIDKAELEARTRELMDNPQGRSEALNAAMAKVVVDPRFTSRIAEAVRQGNKQLMRSEKVRRFHVLDRDFSQEHGELTPTMKVKRKALETMYAEIFDKLYEDMSFGIEAESRA